MKRTTSISIISVVLAAVLSITAFPIAGAVNETVEVTEQTQLNSAANSKYVKRTVSDAGLELIKSFEGFYSKPYYDYGHWSIGYGSYVCPGDDDPYLIYPNGISQSEADKLLKNKISTYMNGLDKFLSQYDIGVNQNQYDALLSFTYNLGQNIWSRSTSSFTLKRLLINGNYTADQITNAFYMWRHAGGKELEGLAKRRLREARLFNSDINMSDPSSQGYTVKNYIVSASYLTVREGPSSSKSSLGSIKKNVVIPILYKDESQKWGFTTYAAFFGWVNMSYLVPVKEETTVTVLSNEYCDDQGLIYTLNSSDKTASLGSSAFTTNTSDYNGENGGYVVLPENLVINNEVYTLTSIGSAAFSKNKKIKKIYIPSSVKSISSDAFKDSSLSIIYYDNGSYAQTFAQKSSYTATDYRCISSHSYGSWNVTVAGDAKNARVEESTCSVCGKKIKKTATSIVVSHMPKKIEYIQSQPFVKDGIKVDLVFDDGSKKDVTSEVSYSNFNSESLGKQKIQVSYSKFTTSFSVSVNKKKLTGIKIVNHPSVTTFIEGTDMSTDGLIVYATFNNGTETEITEYTVSGYNKDKIGNQTIKVSYSGFSASFTVTVKAKTLKSINLVSEPYKKEYYCGEEFDPEGIVITASYDNGTSETITSGFSIKNFSSEKPSDSHKIRIYYGDYYKTVYVSIILNKLETDKYSVRDDVVYGVDNLTSVADFVSAFEASERITVYDKNGTALKAGDFVSTDCTAVLWYNEDRLDSLKISVIGDVNGDGKVSVSDYLIMSDYFISDDVDPVDLLVYDMNNDGELTLTDMVCLIESINKEEQQ